MAIAVALATLLIGLPASAAAASGPKLDAKAWILIDPRDDSVLASSSPNKRLPIASTTKLMTAYGPQAPEAEPDDRGA